tara:strand:+ start:16 stop:1047 length:1032 start_codon:yes stop_codon:yes gene_type:complete
MRKVIALLICSLFLAGQGTSEVVISTGTVSAEPEVGDYLLMEIIDLPSNLGKAIDEEKYLRYSDYITTGMRMEITSKGETMFGGEAVDFAINKMTWDESFTLYYDDLNDDGDGQEDIIAVHYIVTDESKAMGDVFSGSNTTTIENSASFTMHMNMTVNNFEEQTTIWATTIEHTSTEVLDYTSTGEELDEIKVGSAWTETTTERETGTSKERMCDVDNMDGCEWEYGEIDEEETVTTNYEVLRELLNMHSPAGAFDVLEVKETEEGESSGNYTLSYYDQHNLPIAMKMYEENSLTMEMQLLAYKISNIGSLNVDDAEEEGLPSIPFIMSLATIALIASRKRLQ